MTADSEQSVTSDAESVTGIFTRTKAEYELVKKDTLVLREDIDEMQNLFSKMMAQLDQLEQQPRRLKSRIMMEAYERRRRRDVSVMEQTYTVQPDGPLTRDSHVTRDSPVTRGRNTLPADSPITRAPRSGLSSLNTTHCADDTAEGYGRFAPELCSTYVHTTQEAGEDLDSSTGSLLNYSLVTPESTEKSHVRGILKQSSTDLLSLESPRTSPRRRRRRTRVRFAEASDSEDDCDCNDCSKTSKGVERWDDSPEILLDDVSPEILLDDVYSSVSSSSEAEEDVKTSTNESSSNTLNATDVTISPGNDVRNNTNNNNNKDLTSFATDVLFPSPWLPETPTKNTNNGLFAQIEREYEKCCQQLKFDVSKYSSRLNTSPSHHFCEDTNKCSDHDIHQALGETCSLLIDGSLSLLQNSTLEMERGSESGFESTQTALDSSVDSNQTDISSITSAYDMRRRIKETVRMHHHHHHDRSRESRTDLIAQEPLPASLEDLIPQEPLPVSLEATRGSTPDMTHVTSPEGLQSKDTTIRPQTMFEMNFQVDQSVPIMPASVQSSSLATSLATNDKSHLSGLYTSPVSSCHDITPCPQLVPMDYVLADSPQMVQNLSAPQNSPLSAPQNSPLTSTGTDSPAQSSRLASPLMNSPLLKDITLVDSSLLSHLPLVNSPLTDSRGNSPDTPNAPKRQTRRFPTVPAKFVRRLDFRTPTKDLKRKDSLTRRLGQALTRTPSKRTTSAAVDECETTDDETQKRTTYKKHKNLKKRLKLFSNFFHKRDKDCNSHVVETLAHI